MILVVDDTEISLVMKRLKKYLAAVLLCTVAFPIFGFDNGFTLGLRANFTGSLTDPHINQADKEYLGAAFIKGMLGFVVSGEAELTYIFDSIRYFNYDSNDIFGGLGLAFILGLGNSFSGQISGQDNAAIGQIDVYCRIFMTPVLNFGTSLKTYLLWNRLVLGFTLGGKIPLDPNPTYELYSNLSEEQLKELYDQGVDFVAEQGTLVIPFEKMKKINPLGCILKGTIEYCQPVIPTMELTIGGFIQYYIFKPKYITMPKKLMNAAVLNGQSRGIDVNLDRDQLKSFYMNSFDFGISLGILLKV